MSQAHFTLGFPLRPPTDAQALAEQLAPVMPALFQAADGIGTIHYSRFAVLSERTLLFLGDFDGEFRRLMTALAEAAGPVFDAIFRHVEGFDGLPDLAALRAFILEAEEAAAAYARNYGGTVKEIRKAQRVNAAFQRVLDHPEASEALQHPAMRPLLDEASD